MRLTIVPCANTWSDGPHVHAHGVGTSDFYESPTEYPLRLLLLIEHGPMDAGDHVARVTLRTADGGQVQTEAASVPGAHGTPTVEFTVPKGAGARAIPLPRSMISMPAGDYELVVFLDEEFACSWPLRFSPGRPPS